MNNFDKNQQKAINHLDGPMMVLAGPGSGKTTVLVNRLKNMKETGINPSSVLVFTFARAAAREMENRYRKLCLSENRLSCREPVFGTFHSIFYSFLREYAGLNDKSVADENERLRIVRHLLQKPRKNRIYGPEMAYIVLSVISGLKNGNFSLSELSDDNEKAELLDVYASYNNEMKNLGLIDYDDMLLMFFRMLKQSPAVLSALRTRYRYILVDEFQDINRIQYESVKLLCGRENNIFIVGDDDQSIYGFRGSDPSIMLNFRKDFTDAKTVTLKINYRSDAPIVRSSLRLINHNRNRFRKKLKSARSGGSSLVICGYLDKDEEAKEIFYRITSFKSGTVGVLYRTHRSGTYVKRYIEQHMPEPYKTDTEAPSVSCMTFHASKGLEFDHVFIVNANENITPGHIKNTADEEEERRIFYVACTRAVHTLHISYIYAEPGSRSGPSRFIREMSSFNLFKRIL